MRLEWKHVVNWWQLLVEGRFYIIERKMNAKTILGQVIKRICWRLLFLDVLSGRAELSNIGNNLFEGTVYTQFS